MRCEEARAILWPPERPRLVADEVARARKHVAECEACAEYLAQDRLLLDAWERARAIRAPMVVRERVFDALAETRLDAQRTAEVPPVAVVANDDATTALRGSRRGAVFLAIAASLIGILLIDSWPGETPDTEAELYVEEYLRRAVGQDHIETTDPREVVVFLERELGVRVQPLELAGFDLTRAEICLFEGQRGALIVYKEDGREVHHYVVPRERMSPRSPALSKRPGVSDMPVVTWANRNIEQAVVGEFSPNRLLEIASSGAYDRE